MDFSEVTDYIFNLRRFGEMKLGLERTAYLLHTLENPHKRLKVVHVGGTAGKGSTAAMIAAILRHAGYKVGLYTSPHLQSYTERIQLDGERIREDEVVRLFGLAKPFIDRMIAMGPDMAPTFAEVTTALAFYYFAEQKVDFAVVEVMMGGRLDATNIIEPLVSVITNIGLEHTEILGDTIEKIAFEKAGIIKPNGMLVTTAKGKALEVFEKACLERNCRIFRLGEEFTANILNANAKGIDFEFSGMGLDKIPIKAVLAGYHQVENAACAVAACQALRLCGAELQDYHYAGLENVKWPGRLEIMQAQPKVLLDCAKDPLAFGQLAESLKGIFKPKRLVLVMGISADKKYELMLKEILPLADVLIATRHKVLGRALHPSVLVGTAKQLGFQRDILVVEDVQSAVKRAIDLAGEDGLVCVAGSVFTVGEARELWHPEKPAWGREMNESALAKVPQPPQT
jgi:dihydrofolate synthase/folylpolyglutamate synthase